MSIEETIIHFGAPVLCGIKPSSVCSVNKKNYDSKKIREWNNTLAQKGIHIVSIPKVNRNLLFIYDKVLIKQSCSSKEVNRYLSSKQYPVEKDFNCVFSELLHRLSLEKKVFPHEAGVFLGYPLNDVVQFEKKEGRDFKYSGLWKVYGDVSKAKQKMAAYKSCSSKCEELLKKGMTVPSIANIDITEV